MSSHDELDDVLSSIKKKKATTGNGAGRTEILSIDMGNSEIDMTESGSYPRAERPRLRPAPEPADWGEDQGGLSSPPDRQKTERLSRQLAQQALPETRGRDANAPGSQDQQWDALWQSVAVKKKKPEMYDYEAEEEYSYRTPAPRPAEEPYDPPRRREFVQPRQSQPPQGSAPQAEAEPWDPRRYRNSREQEQRVAREELSEERTNSRSPWQEPYREYPRQEPSRSEEPPRRAAPPSPQEGYPEREPAASHKTRQFHLTIPDLEETPPAQTRRQEPEEAPEEEFLLGLDNTEPQRPLRREVPAGKRGALDQASPSERMPRNAPLETAEPSEPQQSSKRRSLFEVNNKSLFDSIDEEDVPEEPSAAPTIDPEEEEQLHSRRKTRVNAFFAKKEFDVDQEDEEDRGEQNEREPSASARLSRSNLKGNFGREESDEELRDSIEQNRKNTLIRLGITAAIFGLLFWFHLGKVYLLLMPGFMWPEYHPLTFIAINFGLLLAAALVNAKIVGGGLLSLFTLKPNNDSLTALSVVASVVQCAALTIMPEYVMDTQNVHIYCYIPVLALVLGNVGRFMYINRVDRGSRIVSGSYDKYAIMKVENPDLARELTRGLDIDDPSVAVSVKVDKLVEYSDASSANDFSEGISRILAPICLAASVIVSAAGYFLSESGTVFGALTAFAALTAVCSPLTASIAANMPLGRMSKLLHKEGAMLASYQTADEFSDISTVVLDATDLFSPKEVTLFTVKPFAEKRIDEALLDAASLICATRSTLTGIFSNIIQGQKSLLRPVENIVYEDGMGLSAWVNKKRVLIGNRALMQHYGVDTPSKDFEAKYCRDHRDILYLANSGELSAMFVLGYSINEEAAEMLRNLIDQNITIAVSVNDPNVTAEKICRLYEFPMEDIRIVPAQTQEALVMYCQPRERARAEAAHIGAAPSMVHAVCAAYSAKTAVVLATMIQFIGVFLGYAVLTFFVFTGSFATITPDLLAIYLAIWAALVVVIPRLRKI